MCKTKIKHDGYLIVIDNNDALSRIDNFLFKKLKNIPKSRIYRMIRSGEVRVNKRRVKASYKIQEQDIIRIPPIWQSETPKLIKPGQNLINLLLNSIIFENDDFIVVNKPVTIASHSGTDVNFGVIEILREAKPEFINLSLVHRLDRDTSGCMLLAKNNIVLRKLHDLMRNNKISKKYIALVFGAWIGGKKVVNKPLLKGKQVMLSPEGKNSITIFNPIKTVKNISLIEAELKTGRTHQIRVHVTSLGYPIVGDEKHGDRKLNKEIKKSFPCANRMFLHSSQLEFIWLNNKIMTFTAPLDSGFKLILT